MSSLAAARADNFYYPRDWDPSRGSLNAHHGSHPLGARARADGTLVVRFELPFNAWCDHCGLHIGRGVRFNARKRRIGAYHSTPLYEFAMSCTQCHGELIIATDPEHRTYRLARGLRKQRTLGDADDDTGATAAASTAAQDDVDDPTERGVERLNAPDVADRRAADAFFALEHEQQDQRRARARAAGLERLQQQTDERHRDDVAANAALRRRFREEKTRIRARQEHATALGLGIALVDVHEDDRRAAKGTIFRGLGALGPRITTTTAAASGHRTTKSATTGSPPRTAAMPTRRPREDDGFAHFGDATASRLHRLKKVKREQGITAAQSRRR